MKIIITLLTSALSMFACAQVKNNYFLQGRLQHLANNPSTVYLQYYYNRKFFMDSAIVINGSYTFRGRLPGAVFARLSVIPNALEIPADSNSFAIFLDRTKINVVSEGKFLNAKISGSPAHEEYKKISAVLQPYYNRLEELWKDLQADTMKKRKYAVALTALEDSIKDLQLASVKAHPASPISLYLIKEVMGVDFDGDKIGNIFAMLPATIRNSEEGKTIAARIEVVRRVSVGRPAIEFTQADTSGVPVSLSSFRGKYVLLDFWASWCHPCREENPAVVEAFKKYKDKGFTIVGVSLDNDKDRWIRAIHTDGLTWTQVCEGTKKNSVAEIYGILGIPQNFLIDPNGIIIAKDLMGDKLAQELEKIFRHVSKE